MSSKAPHQSFLTRNGSSSASSRVMPSGSMMGSVSGGSVSGSTGSVSGSPAQKDVLRMKQEELLNLQESRVLNAERVSEEKTHEVETQRQQQMKMKEDYEYNLGLLDERDAELEGLDHEIVLQKQQQSASAGREESKKIELESKFREIQLLHETYRKQESMLQEEVGKLSSRAASIEKSCADELYTLRTNLEGVIRTLNEKVRQGDLERERALESVRNEQHRLALEREKLSESLLKQKEEEQFVSKSRVLRLEKEVDTLRGICTERENVFVKFEAQHTEANKLQVNEREEHLKVCDGYEDTLKKLREQHEALQTEHQKLKSKTSSEEDANRVLRREMQVRDQELQDLRARCDREAFGQNGVEESYKVKFTELECELDDMRRKYKDTVLHLKEESKRREELLKNALHKWEERCTELEGMLLDVQQEHQNKVEAARDEVWARDRELARVKRQVGSLEAAMENLKGERANESLHWESSVYKKKAELERMEAEFGAKTARFEQEKESLEKQVLDQSAVANQRQSELQATQKDKSAVYTKLVQCGEEKSEARALCTQLEAQVEEFRSKTSQQELAMVKQRSEFEARERADTDAVEQVLANVQREREQERAQFERSSTEQQALLQQLEDQVQMLRCSSTEEDTAALQIMNEYTHLTAEQQQLKARMLQPKLAQKLTTVYDQTRLPQYKTVVSVLLRDIIAISGGARSDASNQFANAILTNNVNNNSNSNSNLTKYQNNHAFPEESLASVDLNDSMFIYKSPRFALPSQRTTERPVERQLSERQPASRPISRPATHRSQAVITPNPASFDTYDTHDTHLSHRDDTSIDGGGDHEDHDSPSEHSPSVSLDVSTEAQYVARIHDLERALVDALDERDAVMKSSAKQKKAIQSTVFALPEAEHVHATTHSTQSVGDYYTRLVDKMEHITNEQELDKFSDSYEDDRSKVNTVNVVFDNHTTEIEITPQKASRMPVKVSERATASQLAVSNRLRDNRQQKQRELDERVAKKNQLVHQLQSQKQ